MAKRTEVKSGRNYYTLKDNGTIWVTCAATGFVGKAPTMSLAFALIKEHSGDDKIEVRYSQE